MESTEGQGTRVRVVLPGAAPEPVAASEPALSKAPPAEAAATPGTRALVIDDEVAITNLIEEVLAKQGWQATAVNDPTNVESFLDQADFDLVICDLKMPRKSGLEILSLLREKKPELAQRFLLVTGNLADVEGYGPALAGVPILRKPFTLAQFENAIEGMGKKRQE